MPFRFLTAEWRHLALVTYAVRPERVALHLPDGLVPDTREGHAFVSLVGLEFRNTRVCGVGWPGLRRFPELNLRLYARHPASGTRGVVFVREIVPKRVVAWAARTLYGEPYVAAPMQARRQRSDDAFTVTYRVDWQGREQRLRISGMNAPTTPPDDSLDHFLKEHTWGFGTDGAGRLQRYRVEHPTWTVHPVDAWHLTLDWQHVYGDDWAFLQHQEPASVLLATGSPVEVFWRQPLDEPDAT